ncbi:MAG: hypothetical protein EA349_08955 [Halomonadaceae bacterium]|nr:MAG: hypothetical protein EA349_08955 [Halomonadaceae bacterium]
MRNRFSYSHLAITAACAAMVSTSALASGQYVVEDAELIGRNSCDLELWHSDADEASFVNTTCRGEQRFQGNLEIELPRFDREVFAAEGKWLFRDLAEDNFGLGLFGGAVMESESDRISEYFLLVPFSIAAPGDHANFHFNLGATRDRVNSTTELLYGAATEAPLAGPFEAVAEVFGTDRGDPTVQVGLRMLAFSEQLSIDVSYLEELDRGGANGWAAGVGFTALQF